MKKKVCSLFLISALLLTGCGELKEPMKLAREMDKYVEENGVEALESEIASAEAELRELMEFDTTENGNRKKVFADVVNGSTESTEKKEEKIQSEFTEVKEEPIKKVDYGKLADLNNYPTYTLDDLHTKDFFNKVAWNAFSIPITDEQHYRVGYKITPDDEIIIPDKILIMSENMEDIVYIMEKEDILKGPYEHAKKMCEDGVLDDYDCEDLFEYKGVAEEDEGEEWAKNINYAFFSNIDDSIDFSMGLRCYYLSAVYGGTKPMLYSLELHNDVNAVFVYDDLDVNIDTNIKHTSKPSLYKDVDIRINSFLITQEEFNACRQECEDYLTIVIGAAIP